MTPALRVAVLGSGTSHGIPTSGCPCAVCASPDPRDRRRRCSVAVLADGLTLVIDTPPDFRLAATEANLTRIDAVLFTHTHADHIFGLDDVRAYTQRQGGDMPIWGTPDTLAELRRSFSYIFAGGQEGGGKPKLDLRPIDGDSISMNGVTIQVTHHFHGELPVLGFRIGRFAYVTDCSFLPPAAAARLRGLDVLILDGLRPLPHPTHFNIEQAVETAQALGARRTFLTHLTHDISHREWEARLPAGIRLAYDGLILDIDD